MLFLWLLWNPLTGSQASDLGGLVKSEKSDRNRSWPVSGTEPHTQVVVVFFAHLWKTRGSLNRDLTTAWGVPVELRGQDEAGWLKEAQQQLDAV